jgi:hypothetical protein
MAQRFREVSGLSGVKNNRFTTLTDLAPYVQMVEKVSTSLERLDN